MYTYIYIYIYIYVYSERERERDASSTSQPSMLPTRAATRYRGTSLTRNRTPLGPYRRPVPRDLR